MAAELARCVTGDSKWPGNGRGKTNKKYAQTTLTQLADKVLDLIVAFWQFFHHDRRTVINVHGKKSLTLRKTKQKYY